MRLLGFELRKVWMGRLFALLAAVLAAANLLLLWMGARPAAGQPSAASWRRLGAELAALPMEQRGDFLHGKVEECGAILNIDSYYVQLAYGDSEYLRSFRDEYDDVFAKYEQEYLDKSYSMYTDDLYTDYAQFDQAASEYDTVAAYPEFLADIQTKTSQLAGISIFRDDSTGYDLRNIERTAAVYAGMEGTVIDYYPQKGLYTALSYPFTDLLLLAAMLLLALLLVRQERDSGLLGLVRSLPAGRLKTAIAKLAAFALSLLAVLVLLYGVNLFWCGATYGLGPLGRSIQSVPALMRCTLSITVAEYLVRFLLAKWAGAFVMGLWVMLAALAARRTAAGWVGALALPRCITLFDLLVFWVLCRVLTCLCMGAATLWLGQRLGGALPALFVSAAAWCLPPLLALSGMDNGVEWLGAWPLFGAVGLLRVQGHGPDGAAFNHWWMALAVLLAGAATLTGAIARDLAGRQEWAGLTLS